MSLVKSVRDLGTCSSGDMGNSRKEVSLPWKDLSLVQQRKAFIDEYLKQLDSVSELCRRFAVSRKTAYKWTDRFLAGCELTDRSRRPHSSPRATSATLERLSWRLARSILVGGPRSCEPCSCAPTPASSCPRSVRSQPSSNAMGS